MPWQAVISTRAWAICSEEETGVLVLPSPLRWPMHGDFILGAFPLIRSVRNWLEQV